MDFFDNLDEVAEVPLQSEKAVQRGGGILALDIGSIYTRGILLDVVDGTYRFVARAQTPTTTDAPWQDILEGVFKTLEQLAEFTGRRLVNFEQQLIIPQQDAVTGVDIFLASSSAGRPIRAMLVGLVPHVSMNSGQRAAESTYLQIVDTLSLADNRRQDQKIDAILTAKADLILIVGGTDGGAIDSMRRQIDTVAIATSLMDRTARPIVLYAGNKDLVAEVKEKLTEQVGMQVIASENVRPTLDIEHLDNAQSELATLYHTQKARYTAGFAEVGGWTEEGVRPTAHSFNRAIKALSEIWGRSVLGIDIGSSSTTISATIEGENYLNVFTQLGLGHSAGCLMDKVRLQNVERWLTFEPEHPAQVLNSIHNKSAYPATIPATPAELEIEYAMVREIIRTAIQESRPNWRKVTSRALPLFRTILLTGSALSEPPHYGWSVFAALDSLLPIGRTRLLLDPYGISPALGNLVSEHPIAVAQTLESGAFVDLGEVFTLMGRGRRGDVAVRGQYTTANSAEKFTVPFGSVKAIPIPYGVETELTLNARWGNVETGARRSRKLTITGGELGLVIDARGRPWRLPRNAKERRQVMADWHASLMEDMSG